MTIQLFQPSTDHNELLALTNVLDSHWLGKGKKVAEFETAWADHVGVSAENMVSTNSCTSALFEAVRLAGIGAGDEVIIPSIHFVGAAQAVIAAGGKPVFCDVDKWTMNAADEMIDTVWTKRTRAVILNHYGGNICRIERGDFPHETIWIDDLANAPMVKVGIFGICDFAVWSFDSMKVLTCGDGGMLYAQHSDAISYARSNFCLGVNSESGISNKADNRWWEFNVVNEGHGRHLMNDLQAAMGLEQLKKLDKFILRRKEIIRQYTNILLPDATPVCEPGVHSLNGGYFFWVYSNRRNELARYLRDNNIYVSWRYHPLHLAYNTGDKLPNAEWLSKHALLLPLHNNLQDSEIEYICETIREFCAN